MGNPNYEALRDAIARNSAAVLSLPSAGMVRHQKTRFLAEAENGFWIECDPGERPLVDSLMTEDSPVGVSFKTGHAPLAFVSPIRGHNPRFAVNETTAVEAIFLTFPENFRERQRRQAYRVALPVAHDIALRIWHIPDHAVLRDRPMAAQEIGVRLTNISVMGIAANAKPGRDGKPPRFIAGERVRIALSWPGQELLTEGRLIHFHPIGSDGQFAFGVQFKRLEKDIEGRQTLSKLTELVGTQQREEIKRRRNMSEAA
jgi:c-di-GMP-binding flagellar brake protein YcgR